MPPGPAPAASAPPVPDSSLLAQVVAVSADAIYTEDLAGRITSWNAAAERLYGRSADEVLGRPAEHLHPHRRTDELQAARDRALAGQQVERFDTVHERADGAEVPVSLTASPLLDADGAVLGIATSVQDISERVHLAERLAEADRELRAQHDQLLRSNRDLEQFAYVASHDLSEPLRVVTGYVQLLERRYAGVLDERGERYVQHVVDGCARMRDLIEDLLHYSRFLRSDGPQQVLDLRLLVDEVLDALAGPLAESGARVAVGDLHPALGEAAAVRAALQNLVANAAKFRRPGTAPHVEVSTRPAAPDEPGGVVLVVDDDGIGIPAEFREKVFLMFQRLHVREEYGGTGIGLAIVQKVADQGGGRAWVEDSPLGGSRFCVSLPAPGAEEQP